MSWSFVNLVPVIHVRLTNPFLNVTYPADGAALGIFDTGYDGFLLLPKRVFRNLRLHELRGIDVTYTVADGRRVRFTEVPGVLELPDLGVTEEGGIQTHSGVREILVGMAALRHLVAHVHGCRRTLSLEEC